MSSISRGLKRLRLGRKKNADSTKSKATKQSKSVKADKASKSKTEVESEKKARQMRKRLSITDADTSSLLLDGIRHEMAANGNEEKIEDTNDMRKSGKGKSTAYDSYAFKSKVGLVPFNPNKVNQDRAMIGETMFGKSDNGLFGVFDGHGVHGDDVSSFLMARMPVYIQSNATKFEKSPSNGLKSAFEASTKGLLKSNINCTFSGSTGTVTYLNKTQIWTANAGDSRAVLGQCSSNGKWSSVALSFDNKPDNKPEQKRIEKMNGRVEPCRGPLGDYIGPARVWLKHQDMPGLAMSRSFGDDVATAVGVNSEAEIVTHERSKNDRFIILGSDGIWEFISNDEAVNLISHCKSATDACALLSAEATKRWQMEEEVIDDITCVVVYL